jgi:hypothetical protein
MKSGAYESKEKSDRSLKKIVREEKWLRGKE